MLHFFSCEPYLDYKALNPIMGVCIPPEALPPLPDNVEENGSLTQRHPSYKNHILLAEGALKKAKGKGRGLIAKLRGKDKGEGKGDDPPPLTSPDPAMEDLWIMCECGG